MSAFSRASRVWWRRVRQLPMREPVRKQVSFRLNLRHSEGLRMGIAPAPSHAPDGRSAAGAKCQFLSNNA